MDKIQKDQTGNHFCQSRTNDQLILLQYHRKRDIKLFTRSLVEAEYKLRLIEEEIAQRKLYGTL